MYMHKEKGMEEYITQTVSSSCPQEVRLRNIMTFTIHFMISVIFNVYGKLVLLL